MEIEEREIEHASLARTMAGECMVLLENNGALPFAEKKVALFGNGALRTIKGGTGSGDVNSRFVVNVVDGLKKAGIEVVSSDWLDRQEKLTQKAREAYHKRLLDISEKTGQPVFLVGFDNPYTDPQPEPILESDLACSAKVGIYVIARNSGEGCDRQNEGGDYKLSQGEIDNLKKLAKGFDKSIVVLNVGGVCELTPIKEIEGIDAVLLMAQLGNLGGEALCDVLTGCVTPSGKLTDTWAKDYLDYPSSARFSHNGSVHDELYEDGIFVGYRYFDSFKVAPLYPFGYGLSYTSFSMEPVQAKVEKTKVTLSVQVTNTGAKYSGKEVVQVYCQAPKGKLCKAEKELRAFAKTRLLAPGESQLLPISFQMEEAVSYDEEAAQFVLDAGCYRVLVGNSSRDVTNALELVLDQKVVVRQCKNVLKKDWEVEEIRQEREYESLPPAAFKLPLKAEDFTTATSVYQKGREEYHTDKDELLTMDHVLLGKCSIEELTAQLSVTELAHLCVGAAGQDSGVLGNASTKVPGAAGDTTSLLFESRGIKNVITADGPAGLRLQPHYKTDKKGTLIAGGEVMGDIVTPFDPSYSEEDTIDYYQYCTAIPIGWALAMSFNTELVEEIGDMIGREMELFHVDLWLAPAMNIHRNPLCGRNFEYYSEDPLVSGRIAAAITRGVQKHAGKGTCIKHFAANNQEDNRYFVNAHISERALREIYLKGFEIAIKESGPLSLMTSYNLINGTHTCNSYDLIQSVLRDEWGYQGTVMTDWCTTMDMPMLTGKYGRHYSISSSVGCIYAGNDLQMPGCKKNVEDIIEAIEQNREIDGYHITRADLQYCGANLLRVILATMNS